MTIFHSLFSSIWQTARSSVPAANVGSPVAPCASPPLQQGVCAPKALPACSQPLLQLLAASALLSCLPTGIGPFPVLALTSFFATLLSLQQLSGCLAILWHAGHCNASVLSSVTLVQLPGRHSLRDVGCFSAEHILPHSRRTLPAPEVSFHPSVSQPLLSTEASLLE